MARLTGPLHSDSAAGSIANSVTYANCKGRSYARAYAKPSNPKASSQVGSRVMLKYLSQLWNAIATADKDTWDALALGKAIAPYHAYIGENLARWQTNKAPTQAFPAAETGDILNPDATLMFGAILNSIGYQGYAELTAKPDMALCTNAVAVCIFRNTAAPTKSWANCIAVLPVSITSKWYYTDSPLIAGTYHYKIAYMSDDGCIGALSAADNTAVVT